MNIKIKIIIYNLNNQRLKYDAILLFIGKSVVGDMTNLPNNILNYILSLKFHMWESSIIG